MNLYHTPMIPGPFDDSACARQIRMGLLDTAGKPNLESVAVLARVYAGLMFDDLCETSPSIEEVYAVCDRLETLGKEGDARKALLYICVQYDGMLRALPEPIWWIVGNAALVQPFVESFGRHMNECRKEVR